MLILIEDTRQQAGKHRNIEQYCQRHGITIVRQCLSVGDYMIGEVDEDGEVHPVGDISCDSKFNCMELLKDVMSNDHRRFRRECERAVEQGIQLIVLVEEAVPYGEVEFWEVPRWKSSNQWHRYGEPMSRVDPKVFAKALRTMTNKYGVKFRFCTRRQSPGRVIKYLRGEYK